MVTEVSLIAGVLIGAIASGLVGVVRRGIEAREAAGAKGEPIRLSWAQDPVALAKNLLVLERVAEDFESTPLDIAVGARLTPRELAQIEADLIGTGLIERSSSNLVRLTGNGREVLAGHRIEEASAHRADRSPQIEATSVEELDAAISRAVAKLNAQPAH